MLLKKGFAALMIVVSLLGGSLPFQQEKDAAADTSSQVILQESVPAVVYSANETATVFLSSADAESIALKSLGLTAEQVRLERTEQDREKGQLVWEVEFRYENIEYDFEIHAETGEILNVKQEREASAVTPADPIVPSVSEETPAETPEVKELTAEDAVALALADAQLTREQVTRLKVEKDRDDGVTEYDIEFYFDNAEYDYTVHAVSGKILEKDVERKQVVVPTPKPEEVPAETPEVKELTAEEAVALALADAKLTREQVARLKVEKDRDDGVTEYDIEFYFDNAEYDYTVHAVSGKILEKDVERKQVVVPIPKPEEVPAETPEVKELTSEEAVALALADAKLTREQVTRLKVEKDRDDGLTVYEVEFNRGNVEYEYTISLSGKILEKDVERDD